MYDGERYGKRKNGGIMRISNRFADARNTVEGKVLSVFLSLLLVFAMLNLPAFTDHALAAEGETDDSITSVEESSGSTTDEGTIEEDVNDEDLDEVETDDPSNKVDEEAVDTETVAPEDEEIIDEEETNAISEEEEEAELPYSFNLETKALVITGLEMLDGAKLNEILSELGITRGDILSLEVADVESIPSYAFSRGLNSVRSITLLNVETVGDHAFSNLSALEEVVIENVTEFGNNAFSECDAMITASLNNIAYVGPEAFRHNDSLSDLSLSNIQKFDRSPFSFCIGLTDLTLDGSVLGANALSVTMFYGCTGLKTVTLRNFDTTPVQMFNGCTGIETATLENIDTIEAQAFFGCTALDSVTMSGIGTIGASVLQNASNVKTLVLNDVATIGEQAFLSTYSLKEVTLDSVATVGKNAFASCKGLEAVTLNNVDTIGQYAFYNCIGLQTVDMDQIRFIDNYAFWGCSSLTTVNSLSNVSERINGFTFYGCKSLTGLTVADLAKMGYIGSNDEIMKRVEAILAGKFQLDNAEEIGELTRDEEQWLVGSIGKSGNWDSYDNGTQIMQQARWEDAESGVAEVQVDAYYTGAKQMDYIFVADLSASMAQLGNPEDNNARFYDMQSKLLDMTGRLLDAPGYDCQVAIVAFGGEFNGNETVVDTQDFLTSSSDARAFIQGLEPLNENTNYERGLARAYSLVKVQHDPNRKCVMVFLSDGAPNLGESDNVEMYSQQFKDSGIDIYGVLHSPTAAQHDKALDVMNGICNQVYESTNTEEFGAAMNKAFTAVYGNNTVTIPVNAEEFDVSDLSATAGTVSYSDGVITWTLNGMPFTDHKLTYSLTLKEGLADRVGTYTYAINDGEATFGHEGGAAAGLELSLSRTVEDPTVPPAPVDPDIPTTPPTEGPVVPVVPAAPAPAPAPAAAPVVAPLPTPITPVALTIPDDANPLAEAPEPEEEAIEDDATPMSAFDEPHCWVHWFMILGIIITLVYGAAVVIRRRKYIKDIDNFEDQLIGRGEKAQAGSFIPVGATQS